MFHVYSALLYLFAAFYFPYMWVKLIFKGKNRAGIRQRLGVFEKGFFERRGDKAVWIHAVSVGETLAALPMVRALKERHPRLDVFFSTVTETGNKLARENVPPDTRVFYFPFDFWPVVKGVVRQARPDVFVVVETELWPNLLRALDQKRIPALMVNGRISPRSFKGYSRAGFFMKRVLKLPVWFNMQTARDAERIKALGAPADRVSVAGNVKFDQACSVPSECGKGLITRAALGVPEDAFVMIAGSTHEGEEAEVITAYREILASRPGAVLMLAPRHPERIAGVESLIEREGFKCWRRSALTGEAVNGPGVMLLDTMGELAAMYRVGDINFVGGSFVPVGGHNVLEPVAFGRPVFFGPHMHNFAEISETLKECGVGIEVRDGVELAREALRLIGEPERLSALGRLAKDVLLKNRGALDRNVELIERYLYGAEI